MQILLMQCQCPLGLILHFYSKLPYLNEEGLKKCQCPLGLILHFYCTPSKT